MFELRSPVELYWAAGVKVEPKSNHRVNIVRIQEIIKHPNADSLGLVKINDYQVVVRLADWKVGDLGVYIQPDSVVPEAPQYAFLWADKEFPNGEVPAKYRRVTVRRFRKEYSEGLLLPVSDFASVWQPDVTEGQDVAELLGITHYQPPEPPENTKGDNERGPQYHRWPKSWRGWFWYLANLVLSTFGISIRTRGLYEPIAGGGLPIYDVESLKNFNNAFEPGEQVVVTEKIHGSNGRFVFRNGKFYVGSRQLWKSPKSKCVWRKAAEQNPWIEEWCRAHEEYALYGEIVPTQKGFDYGTTNGQVKFFVFDVLTPEEKWLELYDPSDSSSVLWNRSIREKVPLLYTGAYDKQIVSELANGSTTIPPAIHLREGVVVRPVKERHVHGLGRLQLKLVSIKFLEADSK